MQNWGYGITILQNQGYGIVICFFISARQLSVPPFHSMVRQHIPKELKEMALSMSLQGLCDSDIRKYTGISASMLKRLCSALRTGSLFPPPPINRGRPQVLTAIQIKVRMLYLGPGCCLTLTVPPRYCWAPSRHYAHGAADGASGSLQH